MTARLATPLFEGAEWDFETMERTYDAIEKVALEDLGLDVYANQIEIISSEQMLDAYASHGMPLMYRHWSFGKHFAREAELYRRGRSGLAYEIVINSNPCISYNMEGNTMAVQALVMAHAAFGHNHFFKNNYLFRQWTNAEAILEYLDFARNYIADAEERHGVAAVEAVLDAAHALMDQGVFRYRRPPKLSTRARDEARRMRDDYETRTFNDLWRTVPKAIADDPDATAEELKRRKSELSLPQENLFYFLEKHSPVLETWQRELLRITRSIAQYFYPQKQTKVMNEGCATFVHYYIMNALYDRGLLTEGAMLEALHNHSNVVFQADFDDGRGAGLNPYALGFAMMRDIKRICEDPSPEDEAWFPDFAGSDDWRGVLKDAWANYRDESFIQQFLSPRLIRELKLFALGDDAEETHYTVEAIHDERGYHEVRRRLAAMHDLSRSEPDIQVVDVDLLGDRELHLRHTMLDAIPLEADDRDRVLAHLKTLWGYDIRLESVDGASGESHETASTRADGAEMPQEKASNSS